MSHIGILVVDDSDDDVLLTRMALSGARLLNVVAEARNGDQALAALRRQPPYQSLERPGLVLLDINMPGMDGFAVLDAMKADPELRSIPVIMLTSSPHDEDIVRSYDKGAASYVRKPVEFGEFQRVVRSFELYWTLVSRLPAP